MRVAILGAGNGGRAVAGELSLRGYEGALELDEERIASLE